MGGSEPGGRSGYALAYRILRADDEQDVRVRTQPRTETPLRNHHLIAFSSLGFICRCWPDLLVGRRPALRRVCRRSTCGETRRHSQPQRSVRRRMTMRMTWKPLGGVFRESAPSRARPGVAAHGSDPAAPPASLAAVEAEAEAAEGAGRRRGRGRWMRTELQEGPARHAAAHPTPPSLPDLTHTSTTS